MKKLPKSYIFFYKYLNFSAFIFVITILSVLIIFLYSNFYITLSEAREVSLLQEKVISEKIEVNKFRSVIKNLEKKMTITITSTDKVLKTKPALKNTTTTEIR